MGGREQRHDSDHLQIYFVIYGVFFTLAFAKLVEAVHKGWCWEIIVPTLCLAFIGLRLIYSPEALSRFLLARKAAGEKMGLKFEGYSVVFWHYPILLLQAPILYIACLELEKAMIQSADKTTEIGLHPAWAVIAVLGINTVWLCTIWASARKVKILGILADEGGPKVEFWMKNNFIFGVGALAAILFCDWLWLPYAILLLNSLVDLKEAAPSYIPRRSEAI